MLGLRRALHRALWSCSRLSGKSGNAFLYGAVGLLRAAELEEAGLEEWRDFSVSAPEVDAGLFPDERRFYARVLRPSDRVLIVGCGAGRDLIALGASGFRVDGIDRSPALVDATRAHLARRGVRASVRTADARDVELDELYDAVIFSNGCYSFIRSAATRIATLRRVGAHLAPGGRIILSHHPFKGQSRIGHAIIRVSARMGRVDWSPEPGDVFSRRAFGGPLRYRHDFAPAALAAECDAAGLRVVLDQEPLDVLRFTAVVPSGRPPA